jgi:hypothetical protein
MENVEGMPETDAPGYDCGKALYRKTQSKTLEKETPTAMSFFPLLRPCIIRDATSLHA